MRLLFAVRLIRGFAFGFSMILLTVHLRERMLSATEIGVIVAISLGSASLSGLLAVAATNQFGRRKTLAGIGALMALGGLVIAFATPFWLLALAGLTGMIGVGGDQGPFLAVEQTMLAQTAEGAQRNRAFARYSFTGAFAAAGGGFAAVAGTDLGRTETFFVLFACLGVTTSVIPLFLSNEVEAPGNSIRLGNVRPLVGLSALFAIDAIGGGLVVNAVLVYWLTVKFGATAVILGPSFGVMSLLNAVSLEAAGRLADRIGLVKTMVLTHLPSSLMLIVVPFMPNLWSALGILIGRSAIVSMDQPTRQAYLVSIVKPSERSSVIAMTGAVRGIFGAIGPLLTGAAIQATALAVPFFVAGSIKSLYDLGLYFGFRHRFGDHELVERE